MDTDANTGSHGGTIRLSLGSAVVLGLRETRMEVAPTTLYAILGEHCLGACQFCAQARDSTADPKFLSRVAWPEFELDDVLERLPNATGLRRICLQTLLDPALPQRLLEVVRRAHAVSNLPISVCMNPTAPGWLPKLREAGVDRVGIGLDCATEGTFAAIKPGFSWERYHTFLDEIVDVFGTGSVHLIVGLGESDKDLVRRIQDAHDRHCTVALFAFTPVRGAKLELPAPDLGRYRAIQLARALIIGGHADIDDMVFVHDRLKAIHADPETVERLLSLGAPFRTSGCPSCNRPNYNERPGGAMYNFAAPLTQAEKTQARHELATYLHISR